MYESDLVAHIQQGAHCQPEGEALVVAHKVAHVLQEKVTRPVQVTVTQVGHHLHQGDFSPGSKSLSTKQQERNILAFCCMKAYKHSSQILVSICRARIESTCWAIILIMNTKRHCWLTLCSQGIHGMSAASVATGHNPEALYSSSSQLWHCHVNGGMQLS